VKETKRQYWSQQIAEQRAGGQSVRQFCRERGIGEHSFYVWRRQLAAGGETARFLLLTPRAESARQGSSNAGCRVELMLATGECLRIANGVDPDTLRTVLEAVRR